MERLMLEQQRKREEEIAVRELAAKKTVQSIIGEQYRQQMEERRTLKETEFARNRQHETAYIQKSLAETDPERLKNEAMVAEVLIFQRALGHREAMTQDQSDMGADVTRRHRLKHPGDLNYDAKMTDAMMNTEPNIMRDAFVREEQRRLDRLKYYEGFRLDRERDKEVKEKRKQDDLEWQRKIVNQDKNIFFEEQERRKFERDELKKQYAGELRDQYMKSQEAKINQTGMTALERRINQDNLQVSDL